MPSHIISLHSHIIFIGEISAVKATSLKNAMASTDVILREMWLQIQSVVI